MPKPVSITDLDLTSPMAGADFIAGDRVEIGGDALRSVEPAHPHRAVWAGSPRAEYVDPAVASARAALKTWSRWDRDKRFAALRAFAERCRKRSAEMTELIARETGKPWWDAKAEADLLAAKVDITIAGADFRGAIAPGAPPTGLSRVTDFSFDLTPTKQAVCLFRPHGVMAVLGPFNFPAHLPNGHIIPALATGNTVVFKPSEKAPAVGQRYLELLNQTLYEHEAPDGVVNLVHGGRGVAERLVDHDGIDGVLFTGSWPAGRAITLANLDRPGRILALEMGGNNAAVVMPDADLRQAAIEIVRGAFVTAGQRCTCTRRLVVHEAVADTLLDAIAEATRRLSVGDPLSGWSADERRRDTGAAPFMGPLITHDARDAVLAFQSRLRRAGGEVLVEAGDPREAGSYVTPGIVRVGRFTASPGRSGRSFDPGCDEEVFGPLLRVATVGSLDEAIEQANATRYGLAASIFTRDAAATDRFLAEARAGCVNVNCATAGASGKLPFGGLGHSGNHRPAGSFSLDYTAHPVASMQEAGTGATPAPGMTFDNAWLGLADDEPTVMV